MKYLLTLILVVALIVPITGCKTITKPDGSTEESIDLEVAIPLAQISFNFAESLLQIWLTERAEDRAVDREKYEAELQARETARADAKDTIDKLLELWLLRYGAEYPYKSPEEAAAAATVEPVLVPAAE